MDDKFEQILKRVEKLKKSGNFDLSQEEDLSIAVMNLISLEEHFFMTSQKTGKDDYLELLEQTREVRKRLLGQMIDQHEGETWCITKHLLATTMRIMEVGTKLQTEGKKAEAKLMFKDAYRIYSLFWAVRLKLLDLKNVKKIVPDKAWSYEDLVTKMVDCCRE
jgi:hypothetical protein